MPRKSNKICSYVGCNIIISGTQRRCAEHQEASWNIQRDYNPFYSSKEWKRLSKAFRAANPLCIKCKKKGRDTLTAHADHIKPITEGGDPLSWDNLQPLCKRCHSSKTAKEIRSK